MIRSPILRILYSLKYMETSGTPVEVQFSLLGHFDLAFCQGPPSPYIQIIVLYSAAPEEDSLARSECSKNTFANEQTTLNEIEFGNDPVSPFRARGIDARKRSPIARAEGFANRDVASSTGCCLRMLCRSS
jgi:hypothetical protein